MLIKQLGNGGGLNPLLTNSSFLIDLYDTHSEYLLFDCGFNVMARLLEEQDNDPYFEISKIKHVVISHKHDDHCGNLETLIYWNYFKNNVIMSFYVASPDLAATIMDTTKIQKNFKTEYILTYSELHIVYGRLDDFMLLPFIFRDMEKERVNICFSDVYHGSKPAVGMYIQDANRSIFISGDTKANIHIEEAAEDADIIFHDYSYWDNESDNIHTCKTDYDRVYSQKFKDKVIKYHTGNIHFNENWQ